MQKTVLRSDFAVRIDGVDLADPLSDDDFSALRGLWMQYKVAVFPGQDLDDDALLAFTRRFGPLFVHVQSQLVSPDHPEVMYAMNRGTEAPVKGVLEWHTDQSYTPKPVFGTILYGITIPKEGGETCFADLVAAHDTLPDDLRARVERQTAVYSPIKKGHIRRHSLSANQLDEIPDVTHPMVRTHPYLDRKALYLSPNHMVAIGDLPDAEADALLAELTAHATQPEHVYCHSWSPGDILMWDNTSVMHRRNHFPHAEPRFHKRTGFYLPDELAVPA
jgi:alpha-ketoglutarate-dependent taurine dioxygenase